MRTPRSKQEAILEEYDRGGMSAAEFSRYVGVKYQTFATWIQKRRKRKASEGLVRRESGAVSWVEAIVGGEKEMTEACLILSIGSGVRMEVASRKGAEYAAEVLRHLGVGQC